MKVGDYVRTKDGYISKIICIEEKFMNDNETFYAIENQEWRGAYNGKYYGFTSRNDLILKSSSNIIDLIEVGDYVNEYKVISIGIDDNHKNVELYVANQGYDELVLEQDIKSIVTREMFESMEYKVGE